MRVPKRLVTNAVFRLSFGGALIASVLFRFNFFSLVYLLFLLWLPLLSSPSVRSMKGMTGTYMKMVVCTSSTMCVAQLVFLLMMMLDSETLSHLTFCSTKESLLRHIGLTMLHESRTTIADAIRLILPDVLTLVASISSLTFCSKYQMPKQRHLPSAHNPHLATQTFQDTVQYFSVSLSLCVAGICYPSLSSAIYFSCFVFLTTWWSAKMEVGAWFSYLVLLLFAICGCHIVLLYLFQMHFLQHYSDPQKLMPRLFGLAAVVRTDCRRPFSLTLYDRADWTHMTNPLCLYFCFCTLAVRSRYWFFRSKLQELMMSQIEKLAAEELEKKARLQSIVRPVPGRANTTTNYTTLSMVESAVDTWKDVSLTLNHSSEAEVDVSTLENPLVPPKNDTVISEMSKLSVEIPSVDLEAVTDCNLEPSSLSDLVVANHVRDSHPSQQSAFMRAGGTQLSIKRKVSANPLGPILMNKKHTTTSAGSGLTTSATGVSSLTGAGAGGTGNEGGGRSGWLRNVGIYHLTLKMFQFMVKRSCTCAPMVMMVWGITYHNWMTFVLLIWASCIWMWPNSRQATLTTSSVLVVYGNFLLILQYIYSLDLTREEMPRASAHTSLSSTSDSHDDMTFDLVQVGLVEYQYPVRHLALQVIYCFFFWGTFRHFKRKRERKVTISRMTTAPILAAAHPSVFIYAGVTTPYPQPLSSIFAKNPFPNSSTSPTTSDNNQPNMSDSHNELIARFYSKIHRVFTKYWVVMCVAMFLIVSLEDDNVVAYKIIYMILFLAFVALYGISFSVWRKAMAGFWWVTVVYSIMVLLTVYTYQFKSFPRYWKRLTHLDDAELKALGLEQHNTSGLFTKLLTPTLFVLVCNIQLHYFHVPLLRMTRITYDDSYQSPKKQAAPATVNSTGTVLPKQNVSRRKSDTHGSNRSTAWYESEWFKGLQSTWARVGDFWWRLLELHMMKMLCFMGMLVSIRDLCATNFLLVLYICLCLPYPKLRRLLTSLMAITCSLMVLARMIFQLSYIDEKLFQRRCNNTIGMIVQPSMGTDLNRTLNHHLWGSWGQPFPNMSDSAQWAGLNKIKDINISLSNYVQDHVLLLLMILVDATVNYHRKFKERIKCAKLLPHGVLIGGVGRREADKDIYHMVIYMVNYSFYKFGLEICYFVTVMDICVRLDVVSIIQWCWLLFLIFLPRRFVHTIWPFYVFTLSIMLPAQYLMCLGLPPSLCHKYPWFDTELKYSLSRWLYLPNYVDPPNKWLLMIDFVQFLAVCLQWLVFEQESNLKEPLDSGGDNGDTYSEDNNASQVPDFMMNRSSVLDNIKVMVFNYMYWFTYAIVFLAGTSRVSILCLGYVCFSFLFFWQGQDLLIKPRKNLLQSWNKVLLYNLVVILLKNCFNIVGCVYFHQLLGHCWILQAFSIVCIRDPSISSDANTGDCEPPTDAAGLSMDCFCFATILIQRKIFQSSYFHYVYLELKEQTNQASRGAYLINSNLRKEIRRRHEEEQQTVDKIRRSMIKIRLRQRGTNQQWVPETHNQAIFTGYLQFEGRKEDESESDSDLDEFHDVNPPSPSAFEYAYGALVAGAEAALKRHSLQSSSDSQFFGSAMNSNYNLSGGSATRKRSRNSILSRPNSFHSTSRDATVEDFPLFISPHTQDELQRRPPENFLFRQSSVPAYRRATRPMSLNMAQRNSMGIEDSILEGRESPTSDYNTCLGEGEEPPLPGYISSSTTFPSTILETDELAAVEEESVSKAMFNWGRLMSIIFLKSIDSFLEWLFSLSKDYRYVAYILKSERKKTRERSFLVNSQLLLEARDSTESTVTRKITQHLVVPPVQHQHSGGNYSDSLSASLNEQLVAAQSQSQGKTPTSTAGNRGLYMTHRPSNEPVLSDTAEEFSDFDLGRNLQKASRGKKLLFASYYATIAHSELICYFIIILNQLISASILAMPLPIMVFLWAMLSVPRPTKRFWVTAITYTELVVVIKYLFQFKFYHWNSEDIQVANIEDPFWWPRILGIEKKDTYADCDLALLLALFFHRSILKMHGLWRDENSPLMSKENETNPPNVLQNSVSPNQSKREEMVNVMQRLGSEDPAIVPKIPLPNAYGNNSRPSIPVPVEQDITMSRKRSAFDNLRRIRHFFATSEPESFQSVLDHSDLSFGAVTCSSFRTGPESSSLAELANNGNWARVTTHESIPGRMPSTENVAPSDDVRDNSRRESSSTNQREDKHSHAPEHSLSASEARPSSSRDQSPPLLAQSVNECLNESAVVTGHNLSRMLGQQMALNRGYCSEVESDREDTDYKEPGMDITPPPEVEFGDKKRRRLSLFKHRVSTLGIGAKLNYTKKRLEDLFRPIQKFYMHLIDPSMSASIDVYALMFFFDFITYLILIFNWWAFSDIGTNQNVTKYLEEDRIPSMFLAMLLVQFVLTLIDRAIYLRKFVLGKFIFQIVQVIAINTWMFFIIPKTTKKKFTDNLPVQMWYFFRSIYFGLSAVQIRCGYPTRILGNFLAKRYSIINLVLFKMFRTLPFLLELRALMDWMWTDSSLMLFHWVRLEDIYASVFSIKCNRKFSQDFPYKRGAKRSIIIKYGVGGLLLITLILIIWFPLLFMSLVYTASEKNPPIEATIEITIGAYQPLFKASTQQNLAQFSEKSYTSLLQEYHADPKARAIIKQYQHEDLVEVKLDGNSIQLWGASPPSRKELVNSLKDPLQDIHMRFEWFFIRRAIGGAQMATETSSGFNYLKLNTTIRNQLAQLLDKTNSEEDKKPVIIRNLFPKYIRVPSAGPSVAINELVDTNSSGLVLQGDVSFGVDGKYAAVSVVLMSDPTDASSQVGSSSMEWWVLEEVKEVNSEGEFKSEPFLTIVTFNERVFPQSVSFLAGYGIIGLYLSLVLVIGKFVRMFVSGISYKIPFDELPNVDKVLKLCLDIYLCREVKEFSLEEDLFAKLMYIYRSPDMLIHFTKLKLD